MHSLQHSSFPRKTRGVAALALLLVGAGFSSPLPLFTESFPLPLHVQQLLSLAQGEAFGPEADWDRHKSILAGSGLIVLTPDDSSGSLARTAELLTLSKQLVENTVLESTGPFGAALANGSLVAVELNLFGSNDPVAPPAADERLDTVGQLVVPGPLGAPVTVGWIYGYDAVLYQEREQVLNASTGGTLVGSDKLFTGPVIQASGGGGFAVFLSASESSITGDVRSNGGIRISGDDNSVPERLDTTAGVYVTGTNCLLGLQTLLTTPEPLPSPHRTALDYENLAKANGTFFTSSLTIVADGIGGFETSQGLPVSGVVYCVGDLSVDCSGQSGALTLIAEGSIEFLGNDNTLTAAVDDVCAWAIKDPNGQVDMDIVLSGTGNSLAGRVFAPGGTIDVLGDGSSILGSLYGWKVVVAGEGQLLTDGTTP